MRIIIISSVVFCCVVNVFAQNKNTLVLYEELSEPVITYTHKDVIASGNKSGFETGQAIKIGDMYHVFVNEMFGRAHRDMRISYWTTPNGVDWKRNSTIVNSIPGRTHSNPRSEVWGTGVEFNEKENAWNLFYVAYRAGNKTKGEIKEYDYQGRIWRAKSVVPGITGIAGPYSDMNIVLQPDENSQEWEGQQAVATFNPYKVGDKWHAFYDGHNHIPKGPWPIGLAYADELEGPWKRFGTDINPVPIAKEFLENPQVTLLKDGRYLAVFDSFGDYEISYAISEDGLNWTKEKRIQVQQKHKWAEEGDHFTRTPLCAIEEDDGTFTVFYTAKLKDEDFYALGMCRLKWK